MTLVTGGRSRERILLYGMEGVGKSLAALDIAARVAPARVHIIDNDNAWDRMLEGQTVDGRQVEVCAEYRWSTDVPGKGGSWEFDGRWTRDTGNVIVYHAEGWEANTSAIEEIRKDAEPDDWVAIDSGSALWDDVSEWYVDNIFGASKADYFMQVRAQMEKDKAALGALDGWTDWSVINAQYKAAVMAFLITPPCHLLVTCEEAQVSTGQVKGKDMEDKETRGLYGTVGFKPRAQKRIGHNMQTVIRLERKANGDYCARTVKDRGGREYWAGESVMDRGFSEWYLEEVGGWQEKSGSSSPQASSLASTSPDTQTALAPKSPPAIKPTAKA
jgi:hypothetical protein